MRFSEDVKYTADHEWLSGDGRVGITDYAQDSLGDIVFVELPDVGRELKAGEALGVVESVKSVSDLYSPAEGRVAEVNQSLAQNPELINQDPFGEGWIVRLEDVSGGTLIDVTAYRRQVEGE